MIIMNSVIKFKNDYHEQYKKSLKMIIMNSFIKFNNAISDMLNRNLFSKGASKVKKDGFFFIICWRQIISNLHLNIIPFGPC